MLAKPIEEFLRNIDAASLTEFFLWLLIVLFVMALFWKKTDKHHAYTAYSPTLLTSVGILGTFAGIISGLMDFDPNNIDESIGFLLAGLKTAFITSLTGMMLSIVYKGLSATGVLSTNKKDVIDEEEIGIGDLYSVMRKQSDGIEGIKEAISENDDSSLVGQIKLLRSDLSDQQKRLDALLEETSESVAKLQSTAETQQVQFGKFTDALWIKLQDFADMMSKSATEQVIQALKEVISDFNNNLVEQFGENFKQLNEAVLKLVDWQENYKQQLLDMTEQYKLGVSAIIQTESSVTHISDEAKVIPLAMNDLKSIMEVNQHQLAELESHLEAFKDIRDRAVEAAPEIRKHIDDTLEGVKSASEALTSGINQSAEATKTAIMTGAEDFQNSVHGVNNSLQSTSTQVSAQSEQIKQHLDDAISDINATLRTLVADLASDGKKVTEEFRSAGTQMIEGANDSRKAFDNGLQEMRSSLVLALEDMAKQQVSQSQQVLNGLSKSIEGALNDTGEAVSKQVNMIDQAMAQEIERVMTEMGRALTAISGQFTNDYQKLVNEMKRTSHAQSSNV